MRFKFLIIPLLLLGTAFAAAPNMIEDPCNTDPCQVKIPEPCPCDDPGPFYNQGQGLCSDRLESGYSAPASYDVCGSWDMFINASFIYWELRQGGLALYREEGVNLAHTNGIEAEIVDCDWEYKPGFKIALGMNFKHDRWQLAGEYTRINGTNNMKATRPEGSFLQPLWIDTVDLSSATIKAAHHQWKYWLDIADFTLGRPFYSGTYLTLKPYMGIRGGRIDQKFTAVYENDAAPADRSVNKSDSWLIGPKLGLDTNWFCCSDFRLLANVAGSLFYQSFDATMAEDITDEIFSGSYLSLKGTNKKKVGRINPNLNMDFGLGWGKYFDRSNWHVDILAKYEFQIFWNQNQMRSLNESSYIGMAFPTTAIPFHLTDPKPGDLMIHGLTITAQFDY